jgi:hypothetical protein
MQLITRGILANVSILSQQYVQKRIAYEQIAYFTLPIYFTQYNCMLLDKVTTASYFDAHLNGIVHFTTIWYFILVI